MVNEASSPASSCWERGRRALVDRGLITPRVSDFNRLVQPVPEMVSGVKARNIEQLQQVLSSQDDTSANDVHDVMNNAWQVCTSGSGYVLTEVAMLKQQRDQGEEYRVSLSDVVCMPKRHQKYQRHGMIVAVHENEAVLEKLFSDENTFRKPVDVDFLDPNTIAVLHESVEVRYGLFVCLRELMCGLREVDQTSTRRQKV